MDGPNYLSHWKPICSVPTCEKYSPDAGKPCILCAGEQELNDAYLKATEPPVSAQPFGCLECHNPDGSLNTDLMGDEGLCTLCGRTQVDSDTGFCPSCHEHSANRYECTTCGLQYEKWDKWELYPADQKVRLA